ncbi:hypothetical protein A2Z33_00050 [Candidatus Gottesmanbacteria bacterium RBG_16_52_11]|uniref:Sucrose phosphatase-like domain-containing protein n=1 Tax=Candidatus Gottesmanbacteria bacterium RBG_16_52_11 TaxID=1798374 RepID=A0A1F5YNW5_9BACT|nr:MAG: hypothetical protein A2Z33_00050 [Candidatus Gottesmanbacteria bacterium RBG_16_52_11]
MNAALQVPQIKLLVFDLDGTAIPYGGYDSMPAPEEIQAVRRAKDKVKVAVATGRSLVSAKPVVEALSIRDPGIFSGGTQILYPSDGSVVWQKPINPKTALKVRRICSDYASKTYVNNGSKVVSFDRSDQKHPIFIVYIAHLTKQQVTRLTKALVSYPDISLQYTRNWLKHDSPFFDIHVTHTDATKKHAMQELLSITGVPSHQVMVVGDDNNDLPLFENAGLKVAMGNGTPELKAKADFVTGSVDRHGLAQAIRKFIL